MTDHAQILPTSGVFRGMIDGDARVTAGSRLEVKGIIGGDLIVEDDGAVRVSGIVDGRVRFDTAEVEITGIVGG